jgi:homoserine O-acetyltransferase/O-succinyltransferase
MAETRIAPIGELSLELGGTLPAAELAYVTYGRLAPDGGNAVLLTHGYTSSHLHAEGGPAASEGSWAGLVGPGRAIDTDRFFVVSSNMLGSSFGSTAPRSINPATGRPYGPDFPPITLLDIVTAQHRLLDGLGVKKLVAVAGPSYGGFQALAWGVYFPDFVRGLVVAVSGLRSPGGANFGKMRAEFAALPGWNGGCYYETGGLLGPMTALRDRTLRGYGIEAQLQARFPDEAARNAEITRIAQAWAEAFDAHSMLVLGDASARFDAEPLLGRLRAKVLYVLSSTDALFPPSLAPGAMAAFKRAGVAAEYVALESEHGHLASGRDSAKWAEALRGFLAGL